MASSASLSKFECLNSFIHERLETTAGEIFQVVKDALAEFQEEVFRSRQENVYLKQRLAEISSISSISSEADAHTKQQELPPEKESSIPGPLDLETPEIQVKLELSAVHQDPETLQQLCASSESSFVQADATHGSTDGASEPVVDCEGSSGAGLYTDSYVMVKIEQGDPQLAYSDSSSASQNGNSGAQVDVRIEEEPALHPSAKHVQPTRDLAVPVGPAGELFPCEVCSKSFKSRVLLKKHMLTHQKETAHRCDFCGKCYSHNHALQYHIRSHTGERPYQCKFCNKTFGRKGHVKDHEKIHTGEKPYSCTRCGKRFIWLNQAKLHIQKYHSEEFSIVIKKSTKHGILKIVHQSENKHRCEVCRKSYSSQHVLRNHLRVHTGERPFKCKFCDKTFTQKSHMHEHERIHTGEKKYSCSECGSSFTWLRQAKVHIRDHHDQRAEVVKT